MLRRKIVELDIAQDGWLTERNETASQNPHTRAGSEVYLTPMGRRDGVAAAAYMFKGMPGGNLRWHWIAQGTILPGV